MRRATRGLAERAHDRASREIDLEGIVLEALGVMQQQVGAALEIPFVRMRAIEGLPTMIAKFTTDIPQLSNWGAPLLLGPGSIHVAHTPFEKLAKRELLEAVALYVKVAKQLLA